MSVPPAPSWNTRSSGRVLRALSARFCGAAGFGRGWGCPRPFNSDACRDADTREIRLWGHKAVPALLVWRQYKYVTDPAKAALARAARRYTTQLKLAWAASRRDRGARADGVGRAD